MRKRRNVPYAVRIEVAKFLIDDPHATGRVLKREVEKAIKKKTGHRFAYTERTYQRLKLSDKIRELIDYLSRKTPVEKQELSKVEQDTFTERTYQNIKSEMNLTPNELDDPWHIGACLKYQIPKSILPVLLEEQRRLSEIKDTLGIADTRPISRKVLTIRQARWFALLQPLITPLAEEQYPNDLFRQHACLAIYARWYAHTERISEVMNQPYPDTSHIDTLLVNGDLSEEALADGIMEYCGVNEHKQERIEKMYAWQGYTREQYEKVLGKLTDAEVDLLNEWVRVVGSGGAVTSRKWEDEHNEIVELVRSKNLEFLPLYMKIEEDIDKQELEQVFGKLTSRQMAMFYELMFSQDKDKWLQQHAEFVVEMQKKERENARQHNQKI